MVLFFALKLGLSTLELLLCPLRVLKTFVTADVFTDHHSERTDQRRLSEKLSFTPLFFFLPSSLPYQ